MSRGGKHTMFFEKDSRKETLNRDVGWTEAVRGGVTRLF